MLCCSPNPALKTLQVSDYLDAREVLTNQKSFERRQEAWSNINKANLACEAELDCEQQLGEKSSRNPSYDDEVFLLSSFLLPFSLSTTFKQSQVKWSQSSVCQKHQLGLTELFSYVLSTGKEQMENEKVKFHPKSLPETIFLINSPLSCQQRESANR